MESGQKNGFFKKAKPVEICLLILFLCASLNSNVSYAQGCISAAIADSSVNCPATFAPVCGCDSVAYQNWCVAFNHNGITFWSNGPCPCNAGFSYSGYSEITFFNTSTFATGYSWDFGDGALSTQENPVHQFAVTDTYMVCLAITNGIYCTDTIC